MRKSNLWLSLVLVVIALSGVTLAQVVPDGLVVGGAAASGGGNISDGGQVWGNLSVTGQTMFDGGSFAAAISVTGATDSVGAMTIGTGSSFSSIVRGTVVPTSSAINALTCVDTTSTVTGAATGSGCLMGFPSATMGNLIFQCYVFAANTVTVRACNIQSVGSVTPASGTYTARIFNP